MGNGVGFTFSVGLLGRKFNIRERIVLLAVLQITHVDNVQIGPCNAFSVQMLSLKEYDHSKHSTFYKILLTPQGPPSSL